MNINKKTKLKFNTYQKIIEIISITALLFTFIYLMINFSSIPERVPSHFNASGIADAWSDKNFVFFTPVAGLILYLFITVISFFPSVWNLPVALTEENKYRVLSETRNFISSIKLIMVLIFVYLSISVINTMPLFSYFLPLFLIVFISIIAIFIIRIIIKSKPKI
jgi:uncharacterized membrane protein